MAKATDDARLRDWLRLKEAAAQAASRAERAQGALDQTLAEAKRELWAGSLEEVSKVARKLAKERDALQKEFDTELARFTEQWQGKLEGVG